MKFHLEHMLPKRFRFARVYLEVGNASVFFSLDGARANWYASIGGRKAVELTDKEYTRLRANIPATETVDDDGRMLVVRNARGYEEQWRKPQWVLTDLRKRRDTEGAEHRASGNAT